MHETKKKKKIEREKRLESTHFVRRIEKKMALLARLLVRVTICGPKWAAVLDSWLCVVLDGYKIKV